MSSASKIITDTRNPLLKRREVSVLLTLSYHEPTPSRLQLKQRFAEALGVKPEQIVIKNIRHRYGSNEVYVQLHVYDYPELVPLIEREYRLNRDMGKKKQQKQEQATTQKQ
ncbi:hypothetical protein B9Q11_03305 [Candidatus Marsarchaeota G2 archaeon ECH_B_SAG-F08]|jgi:ribosomal protein S24E|uniref:Small ribosomal subunit protein eS24 n=6 Tax=Candidatus Marsarchaeota TaxID=1978152 RepID=A0A2R6AK67_9ARCH|nr:MAG: hypothetical protein B9Q02_00815 [Candidatus Marsarchaeota G1 archaeon BE_D]PSN89720.1 MAG: hypothetical protein B9Q00_00475 [Candidatus Marsarchaeota G1 archaeon OSP_C]PSN92701.1 MAG: hypothetical protein B9P99_03360 [Candidatus Marsarchaeota G1 archaeon OSP_B]PSN97893.1 MAG: hypothetical protein B9Q11_03305 [Candidatus Marsarchaeota G2 archaeon ECH_B_SAG-F08]PSO02925.1 MAG: hypothetical protein B9Q10_00800 [Candidatus Marsarchaeota G2 archaeon ECH_B_SAG-E12]PSO03815.1 MAG: hypothetic